MKILLTTLNAKYIHSALSLRYLRGVCKSHFPQVILREFTINEQVEHIAAEIFREKAQVVAFSCYIWNIAQTLQIAATLKKVQPDISIVLGGPEVSYDAPDYMESNPSIDFIICGEGEQTFLELMQYLCKKNEFLKDIAGLVYRNGNEIYQNQARECITDLDQIPSPYEGEVADELNNKIVYYETSRGCPFRCQYCLSSTLHGVRYFSLERVKTDLQSLINAGVKQVKFVDRTFNVDKKRALVIWQFILEHYRMGMNFHFELAADLLDDEMLAFLAHIPPGVFQFEIGVQSTYQPTLSEIQRKTNLTKINENVACIRSYDNIHQHLDLIAGLPMETFQRFGQSFNDVYEMKPDQLQLGFLKLLRGSGLRHRAEIYGYQYTSYPPYEVLLNDCLPYEAVLQLKIIEDLLEKYGNSHRFDNTLEYLISNHFEGAFQFFEKFSSFWQEREYHKISLKTMGLYQIIFDFCSTFMSGEIAFLREILKFDLLCQEKVIQLPAWCCKYEIDKHQERIFAFYRSEKNVTEYLKELQHYSQKQIYRKAHIEVFGYDIIEWLQNHKSMPSFQLTPVLFNYDIKNKLFRKCAYYKVNL